MLNSHPLRLPALFGELSRGLRKSKSGLWSSPAFCSPSDIADGSAFTVFLQTGEVFLKQEKHSSDRRSSTEGSVPAAVGAAGCRDGVAGRRPVSTGSPRGTRSLKIAKGSAANRPPEARTRSMKRWGQLVARSSRQERGRRLFMKNKRM